MFWWLGLATSDGSWWVFNYVKWLRIVSLPCQHCLQKLDDSFWDDVFCPVPHQTAVFGTLILIFKLGTTMFLVF